jgi:acetoin utilization deacetylase AcuC-like enzyme
MSQVSKVGLLLDEVFLMHRMPDGHPERPERLLAVRDALSAVDAPARSQRLAVRRAREDELGLVHEAGYLQDLGRMLPGHQGYLDADTPFSAGTWEAALAAAGGALDTALASLDGRCPRGLTVVRPPGHHAEPGRAMGFCFLNNVAVAAAAARAGGCPRVAIVDWDVHHGNGTQDAFWRDPNVLYVSTHQYPFYPGSGAAEEIGAGEGRGATVNVPLPAGSGDAEYAAAFDEVVVPALRRFRPELILVSAGFDAFVDDPLAEMRVSVAGYRRMAHAVRAVADEMCQGRLVCVLEGGYDLDGLGACAAATFEILAAPGRHHAPAPLRAAGQQPLLPAARAAIDAVIRAAGLTPTS